MTDATPEIRKLADTVNLYCTRDDAHDYENCQLCATIHEEIAKVISQALQDERAKRGAVIADAIDAIEETMGHNRTNLSQHDGCLTCQIVERVRALDPEATEAWDALRNREQQIINELVAFENVALQRHNHRGGVDYLTLALDIRTAIKRIKGEIPSDVDTLRERERKLREALSELVKEIDIQIDWARRPGNELPVSLAKSWREELVVLAETEGL